MEGRNKVEKEKKEKKKKKKEKDEKRFFGCLETFRHSFPFSLAPQSNHFHHKSPNSPKIPLSLIVDEHKNTPLPHSYLSYKSTTIHALTRIQITPQFLILLFKTTHSISISLPLSQNNHFSCESSKSISSSLLSHSSHLIQECD